ncbi:hypothetical protein, partial [Rummeliibacillus suwonensis]|uniref:hypothetical protein n=1 Tax=Rummeliibacillus suwonensis TaxID=1306154 RepID=UPI001AAE1EA3
RTLKKSFLIFIASMRTIHSFSYSLFHLKPWISVPGSRFPRARLQSPRHSVPAGLSARAVPAGVAAFHSNPLFFSLKDYYSQKNNFFPV